ncbi:MULTISPECIES: kynureninase [Pseudomonas]|uniref:kynureninase n=1 Tax=Pseudomonas TaxID=286 RepID=UPI001C49C5AC|nr:kynureninase [Pseudomonas sp. C2B4]
MNKFETTRERFHIPEGVRYFDGNSLGLMPKAVSPCVNQVVGSQWAEGLIRSWHEADWRLLPQTAGRKIARLIGANPAQVVACDSTSVNLFKVLVSAVRLRPDRKIIVTDSDAFPTDLYIVYQVAKLFDLVVVAVPAAEILARLTPEVSTVVLTHVDYRSAEIYDMAEYTLKAHDVGALIVWDLSHTAGGVPCDLEGDNVDFAVGCGYKYLNGGPGAPAYVYAAARHLNDCEQPLAGWFGHARPFDFSTDYKPAEGVARFLCGTNPVIGLSALSTALDEFDGVDIQELRARSLDLTDLFIESVDSQLAEFGFHVASPRDPSKRGSHVSLRHAQGYGVMQELALRGYVGDFRMPDYMRFGFAPLYNNEVDVLDLISEIKLIMETRAWDKPEHKQRRDFT